MNEDTSNPGVILIWFILAIIIYYVIVNTPQEDFRMTLEEINSKYPINYNDCDNNDYTIMVGLDGKAFCTKKYDFDTKYN